MLEGRCPKCNFHCFGWALKEEKYQTCPKCKTRLEIKSSIDIMNQRTLKQNESKPEQSDKDIR